jgi:endonuclease YncB( thermonuclease family)
MKLAPLVLLLSVALFAPAMAHPRLVDTSTSPVCPPGEERSPVSVLVAVQLIRMGTTGSMVVRRGMAKAYTLPCAEVQPGAYSKPATLRGRVAAHDIFPRQQLTRSNFTALPTPTYRIDNVTDGDTIVLRNHQRVRLVQIDAPEVSSGTECYGRQASATTKRLLPSGTRVHLSPEPATDRVDDHGRLLRYVIRARDRVNVNLRLVALGAAAPYFFEGRRGRYAEHLEYLAETAWAKPLGFWRACPNTQYNPYREVDTRRYSWLS